MSGIPQTPWPELPTAAWRDTYATLHLWTQIVGKIRLARSPWLNHSWHVTLYVTARGLTTSPIPDGDRDASRSTSTSSTTPCAFRRATAPQRQFALAGTIGGELLRRRAWRRWPQLGIDVAIDEMPNELPDPIPFSQDDQHASYDPEAARRFLQILVNCDRVFKQFRTGFLGKASPVHFFWGSFDLAVTRFSGRTRAAPSRRRAEPARCSRARSLFARSEQRRLLAGRRRDRLSGVLFLRLSRAAGLPRREGAARCGLLQRSARRVRPAL